MNHLNRQQKFIKLKTKTGTVAVIYFDAIDVLLFYIGLQLSKIECEVNSPVYFPSGIGRQSRKDNSDTSLDTCKVLICDNIAAHGVEFNTLILCWDSNDGHTHQYVVEALMRCVSTLFICVVNKGSRKGDKPVISTIIDAWVDQELVSKHDLEKCSCHTQDDDEIS